MTRQRLDWVDFFRQGPQAHGVRIRFVNWDSSAPEIPRTEKRLVRIVRERCAAGPFALRRSYTSEPTIIDCVFRTATAADELAGAIGAAPIKPPLGWATARELIPDAESLRRLLKLGAESPEAHSTRERFTHALTSQGPLPPVQSVGLPLGPDVGQAKPNPVTKARSRLAQMSLEEQADALLEAMTNDGRGVS